MVFDYRRLNIKREDGAWLCPSCGLAGYVDGSSFDANGPLIGTGICPCCMYEPGFDDCAAASGTPFQVPIDALRAYSKAWRDNGMLWRGSATNRPDQWDSNAQLGDWTRLVESVLNTITDPFEVLTTTLWRPVGPAELKLIEASGMRQFPPRLPDQPIFYPVTTREYAIKIARDWNVPASGSGFVLEFDVNADFLSGYRVETAGGSAHQEYWIPAEELPAFNSAIVGEIRVTDRFGVVE